GGRRQGAEKESGGDADACLFHFVFLSRVGLFVTRRRPLTDSVVPAPFTSRPPRSSLNVTSRASGVSSRTAVVTGNRPRTLGTKVNECRNESLERRDRKESEQRTRADANA